MPTRSSRTNREHDALKAGYKSVKDAVAIDYTSDTAREKIQELTDLSVKFLKERCKTIGLTSTVADKLYYSYQRESGPLSRPVNSDLFEADPDALKALWSKWISKADIGETEFSKFTYTVALAPCLAMEMFDRGNKKGPATYFECFLGHLFSQQLGVQPAKKATVVLPRAEKSIRLTMDFIFEMPDNTPNLHLAVKMSTRERIVQAWAHQRLLDASYGDGSYLGVMAIFAETKLDLRKKEVVEICVPDQWLAYQSYLAEMDRIYYFDVPARYAQLSADHPKIISVKQFGVFFNDRDRFLPRPASE